MNDETQEQKSGRHNRDHTHVDSANSGSYHIGPLDTSDDESSAELSYAAASKDDIMLEEFPDGPYGAATNADHLGKSTPWRKGQASVSAHRDQNPVDSNRKVVLDEPPENQRSGSISGQA